MCRSAAWWVLVAIWTIVGFPKAAGAQLPVCPQPVPDAPYRTACLPVGRLLVAHLLIDLAVDHLFKAESEPVERRIGDVFRSMVSEETLGKSGELRAYLDRLDPLKLTKLDTATGMLQLVVPEEAQRFAGLLSLETGPVKVSWQLPARLAGGYWRTPAVLQVAFWEGQRATFRLSSIGGGEIEADVECLVASVDGVRLVTAGAAVPDILLHFDDCG